MLACPLISVPTPFHTLCAAHPSTTAGATVMFVAQARVNAAAALTASYSLSPLPRAGGVAFSSGHHTRVHAAAGFATARRGMHIIPCPTAYILPRAIRRFTTQLHTATVAVTWSMAGNAAIRILKFSVVGRGRAQVADLLLRAVSSMIRHTLNHAIPLRSR